MTSAIEAFHPAKTAIASPVQAVPLERRVELTLLAALGLR